VIEHDVELGNPEGRSHLVLLDARTNPIAYDLALILDGFGSTHIDPHRCIELEGIATTGGFRIAEQHADLHAELVGKDDGGVAALDGAGELAQRLRHQPGL